MSQPWVMGSVVRLIGRRSIPIAVGLVADRLLGEPPSAIHPVAWFGRGMGVLETRVHADDRVRGAMYCAVGVGAGSACGLGLRRLIGPSAALAVATGVAVAGRMLGREAMAIGSPLAAGDLEAARRRLPSLVGRSPDDLPATDIARAVIESVAENSVDAVVAPVVWGLIAGAPGVLAHRAVNTLDAMVGHRSDRYLRFGWASARLDDVMNWPAARLAAVVVAAVRPRNAMRVLRVVRRDAPAHPSPNGGVIESAFAAALDVRLGGTNRYGDVVEDRGVLGDGPPPEPADIAESVDLLADVTTALVGALASVALLVGRRHP